MMVVCWSEAGSVAATPAVPSGYTQIRAPSTTYYDKNYSQSAYHVYAAAQSSISISFQTNGIANWGMAAFALVASGEGLAPAVETDLTAAFVDDASLGAALTVVAPVELTATLIDDASLGATLTIVRSVDLTAAFIDDASLGAVLTIATVGELRAAFVDDAVVTAIPTIDLVYPPPIQVVVILST